MTDTKQPWPRILHKRAEPGEQYWYISDVNLQPDTDVEARSEVDDDRWKAGNYYPSEERAGLAAGLARAAIREAWSGRA